jgi:hypothetical protein
MAVWFSVAAHSFQSARFEGPAGRGGGTNRGRPGPAVGGGPPVVVVLAGTRVPGRRGMNPLPPPGVVTPACRVAGIVPELLQAARTANAANATADQPPRMLHDTSFLVPVARCGDVRAVPWLLRRARRDAFADVLRPEGPAILCMRVRRLRSFSLGPSAAAGSHSGTFEGWGVEQLGK